MNSKKQRKGGQSSVRFSRLNEEKIKVNQEIFLKWLGQLQLPSVDFVLLSGSKRSEKFVNDDIKKIFPDASID